MSGEPASLAMHLRTLKLPSFGLYHLEVAEKAEREAKVARGAAEAEKKRASQSRLGITQGDDLQSSDKPGNR